VPRHANAAGLSPAVRAITTSGTGGHVDPTSNDAGDPNPIAALFANVDRGVAAPVEATALHSPLWTVPRPRRAPSPNTRHLGSTDGDQSLLATSLFPGPLRSPLTRCRCISSQGSRLLTAGTPKLAVAPWLREGALCFGVVLPSPERPLLPDRKEATATTRPGVASRGSLLSKVVPKGQARLAVEGMAHEIARFPHARVRAPTAVRPYLQQGLTVPSTSGSTTPGGGRRCSVCQGRR